MGTKEQNGDSIFNRSQTERENVGGLGLSPQRIYVGFFALSLLSFGYLLFTPYVYDDLVVIQTNSLLRSFHSLKQIWAGHVDTHELMDGTYRPLFLSFISVMGRIFGFAPFVFRLVSIALHPLNALLIYKLCLKYFQWGFWGAIFPALLFLLHPIQVTNIGLVWKQTDLWIALLSLISIWFADQKPILVLLFFLAALGIKESALMIPFFVLGFEPFFSKTKRKERIGILFVSVLIGALFYYILIPHLPRGEIMQTSNAKPLEYFSTELSVLKIYFWSILNPTLLTIDRGIVMKPYTIATWGIAILATSSILFLWGFNLRKKLPWITALWVGSFWLFPTSSFFQLSLFYDETRMYLVVAFIGVILISCLKGLKGKFSTPIKKFVVGSIIFSLSICSIFQTALWKSEERLWRNALEVDPNSPRANYHVGLSSQNARALDDAEIHYRNAVAISPTLYAARLNLGIVLGQKGDLNGAKEQFVQLLQSDISKYVSLAHYHLGLNSMYQKRWKEAENSFQASLKEDPLSGNGYFGLALMAAKQKKNGLAVEMWKKYKSSPRPADDSMRKPPKELIPLVSNESVR